MGRKIVVGQLGFELQPVHVQALQININNYTRGQSLDVRIPDRYDATQTTLLYTKIILCCAGSREADAHVHGARGKHGCVRSPSPTTKRLGYLCYSTPT